MKTKDTPVFTSFSTVKKGKLTFLKKVKSPGRHIDPENVRRNIIPIPILISNPSEIHRQNPCKNIFRFYKT